MGHQLNLDPILRELKKERDRLDHAIASLERLANIRSAAGFSGEKRSSRGRKSMGAAERKEVSKRMKEYWRSRRA
jgi:hypothetical protein